jgi:hypothetical protein
MYASRALSMLLFLAFFVAIATAAPLHSHMRRSCSHHNHANVVAANLASESASPSPLNAAAKHAPAIASSTDSDAAAPSSTNPVPTSGASNGKLSALFPVSGSGETWSTSPLANSPMPLSDSTLNPTKVMSSLSHDYVSAPDGKKAMKAHYPKGSYTFGHNPQGGISFYASGPHSVDLSTAKEATFGYSVFFEEGFSFHKGGKLPGIYGGNSDEESVGCSGGRRSTACFSARMMWRADGKGEFYTYLPPYTDSRFSANRKQCNVGPMSECNPTYGASVGRGAFTFATGKWNTVSERVKLNDVGKANGELELFVGGKSVIKVDGLILRDSDKGRMRGIQMQTFFGGHDASYGSPKDQSLYFSDFSVAILDTF